MKQKKTIVTVRVSEQELEMLKQHADAAGESLSEYCRKRMTQPYSAVPTYPVYTNTATNTITASGPQMMWGRFGNGKTS